MGELFKTTIFALSVLRAQQTGAIPNAARFSGTVLQPELLRKKIRFGYAHAAGAWATLKPIASFLRKFY